MDIKLKEDTLTIKLTKEELQKFMVGGLKTLIDQDSAPQYWLPYISYPDISKDNKKNTPDFPNWTYTMTHRCNADWPWKDENGHMLGGAQMESSSKFPCEVDSSKFPCEAGDLVRKHKK